MPDMTKAELLAENAAIRARLAELERATTGASPGGTSSEASNVERTRMAQAHEASELRYRRLFEAAKDGILLVDAETGIITDVNPYLCDLLGYSREEVLGKALWELGAFKDTGASKSRFRQLQVAEYDRYDNLPLRAKDGSIKQVEFVSNVY